MEHSEGPMDTVPFKTSIISSFTKDNSKVKGAPQLQTAANSQHQEEEKMGKN